MTPRTMGRLSFTEGVIPLVPALGWDFVPRRVSRRVRVVFLWSEGVDFALESRVDLGAAEDGPLDRIRPLRRRAIVARRAPHVTRRRLGPHVERTTAALRPLHHAREQRTPSLREGDRDLAGAGKRLCVSCMKRCLAA